VNANDFAVRPYSQLGGTQRLFIRRAAALEFPQPQIDCERRVFVRAVNRLNALAGFVLLTHLLFFFSVAGRKASA